MRLAKLSEFRALFYTPDSAPSVTTLRARIDRNEIPGGRIDHRRYYVDLDEFNSATNAHATLVERQRQLENDPLLAQLLKVA